MLRELHISNLAVIEDASIDLREGLNCFTGQTGAGKSLIIGAFELLLGLRSATDMLRAGADEGRVSGIFEISDSNVISAISKLGDLNLNSDSEYEQLLITRKMFASGRTSVSINGHPATAAMLRSIGQLLVDVHGQHDHQFLLKPANQLVLLDRFADCEGIREEFGRLHRELGELRQRQAMLEASQALRRQQLELYEFQAQEIDAAEVIEGEFEETVARHQLLSNVEQVQGDARNVCAALYDVDGSIVERLQGVVGLLRELVEIDEELRDIEMSVTGATATLQDCALDLQRYLNRLDLDPAELNEVSGRLDIFNRLIHKFGSARPDLGGSMQEVLAYRAQIQVEIDRLRSESGDLERMDEEIAPIQISMEKLGLELSEKRRIAARRLKPLVETELAELSMGQAEFEICFDDEAERGLDSPTGLDVVEMMVRTNPGQEMRSLRKTASGGELSRIMLAVKSIAAESDRISVLVFDEVDANIGGRMGGVIGEKLRKLASHHQVLCITHLPQIAACADHHLRIVKNVNGDETRTRVNVLDGDERINELAEMLTGQNANETTRTQAQELIDLSIATQKVRKGRKKIKVLESIDGAPKALSDSADEEITTEKRGKRRPSKSGNP